MTHKKNIVFIVCVVVCLQSFSLVADENKFRGKVLKFSGNVEIVNLQGERRMIRNVEEPLRENDTIVTKEKSRIVVQFDDGALSVLDEKSRLRVEKTSWFSYLGGKVYFTFKKVFGEPRRIRTRAATIGVRGTTFIISENDTGNGESVALKEGELQIESTGPAFEIHRQKNLNEFEEFKLQQQQAKQAVLDDFEQYKKCTANEFVEYQRQFTLQSNRVINMSGYRVDEAAMSEKNQVEFELFESEAEDLINAFRSEN